MSDTKISWTDKTWSPVTGCDRVSPGCDHCYALTLAGRLKRMELARGTARPKYQNDGDPRTSGPGFGVTCHPHVLDEPLKWRKPQLVFVCSMADLFHKDVPLSFIGDVWKVMAACPQHVFQVLTKRPQRAAEQVGWEVERAQMYGEGNSFVVGNPDDGYEPLPNVHLAVTIESDRYTWRADHLRRTPTAVRWLSLEPLLGPLPSLGFEGIDSVVIGGESGRGARPMEPEWVVDLIDRAHAAGVDVHVKQLGDVLGRRLGLDPHDFDAFPDGLRVRDGQP